jgi:two-component system sensor histidine kinase BaeS
MRFAALGLRARLGVALVTVAVFAVGLATIVANHGVAPRLSAAAEARLRRSSSELAVIAADDYKHHHGWTRADARSLERLAAINGLTVTVQAADGRPVGVAGATSPSAPPRAASAPVLVRQVKVGSIRVSPAGSTLLSPEEVGLRHSLDALHILAAVLAVAAALIAAFILAHTLSSPLRRARLAAEAITRGDLGVRVPPGGGAELTALSGALNQLAETLQEEERLRKASVADLAHELRTPVGGLLSRIEAAQDQVLPDDAANLQAMHAEATRLTALLNDLSRLADAEQPGLLVDKHRIDLAACAAQQVEAFRHQFGQKRIALEQELTTAWVDGDAGRLRQVVSNLLSNALRYTPPGGTTRIRVFADHESSLLEVSDSGIGIGADEIPHIFKRFWRAEKSRSRATGGAGIGLAIVRQLVDVHGGTVDAESVVGKGSTFRIRLPGRQAPVEPHHWAPRRKPPSGVRDDPAEAGSGPSLRP